MLLAISVSLPFRPTKSNALLAWTITLPISRLRRQVLTVVRLLVPMTFPSTQLPLLSMEMVAPESTLPRLANALVSIRLPPMARWVKGALSRIVQWLKNPLTNWGVQSLAILTVVGSPLAIGLIALGIVPVLV